MDPKEAVDPEAGSEKQLCRVCAPRFSRAAGLWVCQCASGRNRKIWCSCMSSITSVKSRFSYCKVVRYLSIFVITADTTETCQLVLQHSHAHIPHHLSRLRVHGRSLCFLGAFCGSGIGQSFIWGRRSSGMINSLQIHQNSAGDGHHMDNGFYRGYLSVIRCVS